MTRSRRPEDWNRDLERARRGEAEFVERLKGDSRIFGLEDHTEDFERLDFSFLVGAMRVFVDLKEKHGTYSKGVRDLWPDARREDLFIVDETVYRRIIWQGGGGYLVVHDHPERRWTIFGPWELTLGPRVRYRRRGQRATEFTKGKVLLDLSKAASTSGDFSVDDLLRIIEETAGRRNLVDAVPIPQVDLPILG